MKPSELLEKELAWCQHRMAEDEFGNESWSGAPTACKWCFEGAFRKCYGQEQGMIKCREAVKKAVKLGLMPLGTILAGDWNDDKLRTHAEVIEVLKRVGE